ncbi:MAG: hypothetical protein Q8M31_19330 [Beijerinckiaceae bacterium]|nr:hypothetical protein [Beijerinckiaceae bacterium]
MDDSNEPKFVTYDLAAAQREKQKQKRKPVVTSAFKWSEPMDIPHREFLYDKHYVRKYISTTLAPGGIGKIVADHRRGVGDGVGKTSARFDAT